MLTTGEAAATQGAKQRGLVIDADVHPAHSEPFGAVLRYAARPWQRRLGYIAETKLSPFRLVHPRGQYATARKDAITPDGGLPGSDPEFVKVDLLDRQGVESALLVDLAASTAVQEAKDYDISAVLASAFNDYNIERWLGADKRFRLALVVSPWDVEQAVAEIKRNGQNSGIAAIHLPLSQMRWGNRRWYPLWEAAISVGLPIVSHVSSGETLAYDGMARFPISTPEIWAENYVEIPLLGQATVSSLVMHGVFERYPDLKVLFAEWGFTWVPSLVWRMNLAWRAYRSSAPWLKRWPVEVVHQHLKFTSQPVEDPPDNQELVRLVEDHLADLLVFSSDYPHFDSDPPDAVLTGLSPATRKKVLRDNAKSILRL
jgi:uncharacterized protein